MVNGCVKLQFLSMPCLHFRMHFVCTAIYIDTFVGVTATLDLIYMPLLLQDTDIDNIGDKLDQLNVTYHDQEC